MILFLLIIPIYVLWHLAGALQNGDSADSAVTIGVLLIFTLIFSAVLSLFTRARRHEILGAAAAYVPSMEMSCEFGHFAYYLQLLRRPRGLH